MIQRLFLVMILLAAASCGTRTLVGASSSPIHAKVAEGLEDWLNRSYQSVSWDEVSSSRRASLTGSFWNQRARFDADSDTRGKLPEADRDELFSQLCAFLEGEMRASGATRLSGPLVGAPSNPHKISYAFPGAVGEIKLEFKDGAGGLLHVILVSQEVRTEEAPQITASSTEVK